MSDGGGLLLDSLRSITRSCGLGEILNELEGVAVASRVLEQLGQESEDLSSQELAQLALAGQAFDDLGQEPDLYSFSDGEPIVAACVQILREIVGAEA